MNIFRFSKVSWQNTHNEDGKLGVLSKMTFKNNKIRLSKSNDTQEYPYKRTASFTKRFSDDMCA